MEHIPSKPPHSTYIIVSLCTLQKDSTFLGRDFTKRREGPQILALPPFCAGGLSHRYLCLQRGQLKLHIVKILHQSRPLIYRYLWFCKISKLKSETFLLSTKRNDDASKLGKFTGNILHWNKNDIKSSQTTNGDYFYFICKKIIAQSRD